VSKQFENIAKELLKPTYTSSPEDELLKKKNENLDKMENQEKNQKETKSTIKNVIKNTIKTMA
jgi:cation transport regulator ChaC